MADYRYIDDFAIGDTYKLTRVLDSVPAGQEITDAFWTVKPTVTTLDSDASFQIHITAEDPDLTVGQIIEYVDGSVKLEFIATPTVSDSMMSNSTYLYDIQVNLASGEKYALETGKLFTGMNITHSH
jgi:hypothetical protein